MEKVVPILRMGRFTILTGGILAYTLGAAMGVSAAEAFLWEPALAGLLVTVTANLVAHYADEYADIDTDTLTRRTWLSGGSGVLPSGQLPPVWALRIAWILVGFTAFFCILFYLVGWLPIVSIAILGSGLLLGWFYSMPPIQLERRGLGEPINALIGGILMPLMGYTVQTAAIDPEALLALLPIFLFVLAGLLGVHWSDREADAAVGKRSLVVLFGERTRLLYMALAGAAYVLVLAQVDHIYPWPVVIAIWATLPFSVWAARSLARQHSPAPGSLTMAAVLVAGILGWVWQSLRY